MQRPDEMILEFRTYEELQAYVQKNGPIPDGWNVFVGGVRIRQAETIEQNEVNFKRSLGLIQDYSKLAVAALNDEHEGNFKYYVQKVTELSDTLDKAVKDM